MPPDSAKKSMQVVQTSDFSLFPLLFRLTSRAIRPARTLDAGGNLVTGLMIEYRALEPDERVNLDVNSTSSFATISLVGGGVGLRPSQVRVAARTVAYGVSLIDTTTITLTWPVLQWVYATPTLDGTPRFEPSDIRLAPYGVVVWRNLVTDPVDVTFDDPTHVTDLSANAVLASTCDRMSEDFGAPAPCGSGHALMPAAPLDALGFPIEGYTTQIRQFPEPGVYTYHSTLTGATGRVVVTNDPDPNALP